MSLQSVSSTDSKEAVTANSGLAHGTGEDPTSAPAQKEQGESAEASEALENDADESEDKESAESEDQEDSKEEGDKKPKKTGFKKRIDKLSRRLSEREQELEYWKQAALKQGGVKQEPQKTETPKFEASADDKPQPNNFDTYDAYLEALTDWKVEQREKKAEFKKAEEAKAIKRRKVQDAHRSRLQEYVKTQTDFNDVIQEFIEDHGNLQFSEHLEDAIVGSDLGPAIVYELAKNPTELARINSLGEAQVNREIGRLEAKLAKAQESSKTIETKTTKAPPPIAPIGGKGGVVNKSIYDPNLSFSEYERLRSAQLKNKK